MHSVQRAVGCLPIHQVKVRRGVLQEVYVALQDRQLVERLGEPSCTELSGRLERMGVELAEGQVAEINLGIDRWAEEVASALESGFVLTGDYGKTATRLYSAEERPDGTLTTYYRHTQTDDPFRHVGVAGHNCPGGFHRSGEGRPRPWIGSAWLYPAMRIPAQLGAGRLATKPGRPESLPEAGPGQPGPA